MVDNEITTTTTVIYNQITGTIPALLVLYILLKLSVVVDIINVCKGHYDTQTNEQTHTKQTPSNQNCK
jgi:hypothetical protein